MDVSHRPSHTISHHLLDCSCYHSFDCGSYCSFLSSNDYVTFIPYVRLWKRTSTHRTVLEEEEEDQDHIQIHHLHSHTTHLLCVCLLLLLLLILQRVAQHVGYAMYSTCYIVLLEQYLILPSRGITQITNN